ncbi:BatA domain-containing protein [Pirellulaceae bacterium SH467]
MTFLNAILALGATAFVVPLVIHLLYRSRYRVVEWGAMRFLQSARSSNSRRFQLKQWLLLLLRCLIPVFLALAMSRPLVQSWSSGGLGSSLSLAILLDDSISMQALREDSTTRWNYALSQIEQLRDELPENARIAVVLAGSPPRIVEAKTRADLANWLRVARENPSIAGNLDTENSQSLALEWLGREQTSSRFILLATDLEEKDWSGREETWTRFADRLSEQIVAPKFSLLQTADARTDPIEQRLLGNGSIHLRATSPKWVTPNEPLELKAVVFNDSLEPRNDTSIRLFIDEKEIEEQRVSLGANSQTELTFRWTASEAGEFLARIAMESDDRLRLDNESYLPLRVLSPVRVLMVDGDRKPEKMASESDYLKLALAPFSQLAKGRSDPFECTVVGPNEWGDAQLKNAEVVVLCNVPALTESQSSILANWVQRGGGLLVFPGDRTNGDAWNRLPSLEQGGIRSTEVKPRVIAESASPTDPGSSNSESPVASEGQVTIDTDSFLWSKLRELSRPSLESLRDTLIGAYTPITDSMPKGSQVVAKLSNGDAWIIRSPLGNGTVLWFSFSCDRSDSNLPSRAAFVPLVQRIVSDAAGRDSRSFLLSPGEPWSIPIPPPTEMGGAGQPPDGTRETITVVDPFSVKRESQSTEWLDTRQQGVYEAKWKRGPLEYRSLAVVDSRARETEAQRESRLMPWDSKSAKDGLETREWPVSRSASDYLNAMRADFLGREVWSWFWIAAVLCFLAEMAIEQSYMTKRGMKAKAIHGGSEVPSR